MTRAITIKPPQNLVSNARSTNWVTLAIYAILAAASIVPLLLVRVPPLVDYPNHLARMWILVHRATIPELAHNYVVHWRILPDLGMDLVVMALAHVMPVIEAGRVFVALAMLGPVVGTITLYRALHGRFALWPAWSVLFVYNAMLFWGFVDCLFGYGLYLLAFSGWIASRNWHPAPRILLFSIIGAGLFVVHLFVFGLYGLTVTSYEIGRRIEGRRLPLKSFYSFCLLCLQFIPGLVLWYLSFSNVSSVHTAYGDLLSRIMALFAPLNFGNAVAPLDGATWLAAAVVLLFAITRGALRIVPEMKLPLAALVITAIAIPNWLNGGALVDIRLPVILPCLLLAASDLEIEHVSVSRVLSVAAIAFFAVRVWTVSRCWQDYEHWFNEFRQASMVIAPGSRLLTVESSIPPNQRHLPGVPRQLAFIQPQLFTHMGALAVIDRSIFFPYLFTQATPLGVTPRNQGVAQSAAEPISPRLLVLSANPKTAPLLDTSPDYYGQRPFWRNWPRTFDYVLWIDFGTASTFRMKQLQPVAVGSFFRIYRVVRE